MLPETVESAVVRRHPLRPRAVVALVVAYPAVWALLHWASTSFQIASPNISLWYPAAGLAYAVLLVFGVRFVPLLVVHALFAYLIPPSDLSVAGHAANAVIDPVLFGLGAWVLLERVRIDPRLPKLRDVLLLFGVLAVVQALVAVSVSAVSAWDGLFAWGELPLKAAMFWAGDLTGVAVVGVPLLLLSRHLNTWATPLPQGAFDFPRASRQTAGRLAATAAGAVAGAFVAFGLPSNPSLNFAYVTFVPVLAAAVLGGLPYASVAVVALNVAAVLIVLAQPGGISGYSGFPLQFGLLTVSVLGVLMGAFISERRQRAQALARALDQAEAAARLKDAILSNMSHEVRTPLTVILNAAGMIGEGDEPRPLATLIERNGQRLLDTLTLVLEQAQIEAGAVDLRVQRVDVVKLAARVLTACRPLASEKGLTLDLQANGRVEAVHSLSALERVLTHLLENAVKFTEAGSVTVAVESDAGGDQFAIRVADTGRGLPEALVPHVFEPFRQASEGLDREHEGAGLGLAVVRGYVESMGGAVGVESEPGLGCAFRVTLPVRGAYGAPAEDALASPVEALV